MSRDKPVQDVKAEVLDPRRNNLGAVGEALVAAAKRKEHNGQA